MNTRRHRLKQNPDPNPDRSQAILTEPGWKRRRLLFLNLAAPFLEEDDDGDEDGMEAEEVQ